MVITAGELQIKGTLDTSGIDQGVSRVERGLGKVKQESESTFGSMQGLADVAGSITNSLIALGAAGATAMTGLASQAPAVAPSLAKMKVEMRRMTHTAGRIMKPAFDAIANDVLPALTNALTNNEDKIRSFVDTMSTGAKDISSVISGDLSDIKNLIPKTGLMATGAAAGFALLGPKGLFIGAALGYAAGNIAEQNAQTPNNVAQGSITQASKDLAGLSQNIPGGGGDIQGAMQMTQVWANHGKNFLGDIIGLFKWAMDNATEKDLDYATSDGNGRLY